MACCNSSCSNVLSCMTQAPSPVIISSPNTPNVPGTLVTLFDPVPKAQYALASSFTIATGSTALFIPTTVTSSDSRVSIGSSGYLFSSPIAYLVSQASISFTAPSGAQGNVSLSLLLNGNSFNGVSPNLLTSTVTVTSQSVSQTFELFLDSLIAVNQSSVVAYQISNSSGATITINVQGSYVVLD